MQGTIFGSIICTAVIDKLAKIFYGNKEILYKYKGEVKVQILGMVDDVLAVNKCSNEAVISNFTINRFMELNKLRLSSTKCHRMHIGKQSIKCPELQIHESEMETTRQERYLGDIITCDGKQDKNISSRIAKAWSYFAEIKALINEFPFGKRKTEVGLMLREAMFLNGILYNSESWHGITQKHMDQLNDPENKKM